MICKLKIEIPVVSLSWFYDKNWQPDRRYWSGHIVVVPAPFSTSDVQLGGL